LKSGFDDVYQPAAEQFNGRGSYGNGSAMRVAPVALFAFEKKDTVIKVLFVMLHHLASTKKIL